MTTFKKINQSINQSISITQTWEFKGALSHFKRHIALVGGPTMILLPLLLFLSSQLMMMYTMENSALYRNPTGDFSIGDFKRNAFHYLWAEKLTSSMVEDQFDCTFLCVAEPKCYSFNMAAYPDSKGLYLCELLATYNYRETDKFHSNATFHHYSPWVSDKRIYFTLFSSTKNLFSR